MSNRKRKKTKAGRARGTSTERPNATSSLGSEMKLGPGAETSESSEAEVKLIGMINRLEPDEMGVVEAGLGRIFTELAAANEASEKRIGRYLAVPLVGSTLGFAHLTTTKCPALWEGLFVLLTTMAMVVPVALSQWAAFLAEFEIADGRGLLMIDPRFHSLRRQILFAELRRSEGAAKQVSKRSRKVALADKCWLYLALPAALLNVVLLSLEKTDGEECRVKSSEAVSREGGDVHEDGDVGCRGEADTVGDVRAEDSGGDAGRLYWEDDNDKDDEGDGGGARAGGR